MTRASCSLAPPVSCLLLFPGTLNRTKSSTPTTLCVIAHAVTLPCVAPPRSNDLRSSTCLPLSRLPPRRILAFSILLSPLSRALSSIHLSHASPPLHHTPDSESAMTGVLPLARTVIRVAPGPKRGPNALPAPRLLGVSISDLCSTAASGPVAVILLTIAAAPLLKVHARAPPRTVVPYACSRPNAHVPAPSIAHPQLPPGPRQARSYVHAPSALLALPSDLCGGDTRAS